MGGSEIALIFFVILLLIAIAFYRKGKKSFVQEKKAAYLAALKSGDKQAALIAGRNFYEEARGGVLTIKDEQAIANDLSKMTLLNVPG